MGFFLKSLVDRWRKFLGRPVAAPRSLRRAGHYLRHPIRFQTAAFFAAAFAASLTAVLFTKAFQYGEAFFVALHGAHPVGTWFWTPACFAASWYLVWKFAPAASGSGIPQVLAAKAAVEKRRNALVDRLLALRLVPVKIVSAVVGVAGGAAIGREGPTLQVGASVYRAFRRRLGGRDLSAHAGLWITAGAATGLAAAFNTPLGGIVFAIEELKLPSFERFRASLLVSIIIGGLVSQWLVGPYLYLGMPSLEASGFGILPDALLLGLAGGALGALFGRILAALTLRKGSSGGFGKGLFWAVGCGLVVAGLASLDARCAGSGTHLMNNLLFHDEAGNGGLLAGRFGSMTASYLAGGGGGIFAPSLSAGACLGSWWGMLLHGASGHLLVLLGMIAFLTGVTRTPFTSFVLVLEMTDRHSAIFPMMLAALAAEAAARMVQRKGFYEVMKDRYLAKGA